MGAGVGKRTLHGIATPSPAHLEYVKYLLVQAVVVFVFWPKDDLSSVLSGGDPPRTLLAAVLAAGFLISYWSARAGAEEFLFPAQEGLREQAAAGTASPARLVREGVLSHALHALCLLALSSPLVLMSFAVSAGEWAPLGWSFAAILFLAVFYRLAGAVAQVFIAGEGVATMLGIRVFVVLSYVLTAALLPSASHLVLATQLLSGGSREPSAFGSLPGPLALMLLYAAASCVLAAMLARGLARLGPTGRAERRGDGTRRAS